MTDPELRDKANELLPILTMMSRDEMLNSEGQRAAIIMGSSRVDDSLRNLLTSQLIESTGSSDNLFDPDRPLGSFSSRISLAYRMGLIDKSLESALQIVRKIRNNFAHEGSPMSLEEEPHIDRLRELNRLTDQSKIKPHLKVIMIRGLRDSRRYGVIKHKLNKPLFVYSLAISLINLTIYTARQENMHIISGTSGIFKAGSLIH